MGRSAVYSFALVLLAVAAQCVPLRSGCAVRVNGGLPEPQPLLLVPGGPLDGYGFKLPTLPNDTVHFRSGERVLLSCPGRDNFLAALGAGANDVVAVCSSASTFVVHNIAYNFSDLACQSYPFHTARRTGSVCNNGRASEIEIGFVTGAGFYRILDVCFDEELLTAVYTKFDMVAQVRNYQSRFPRPSWLEGSFYGGMSPNSRYIRGQQIATIGEILGDVQLAEKYVSRTTDFFLARGHLTAKVDFIYGSQQRATFYYVNAVPQWQTFNGGNWERLESSVRTYATRTASDLVVYTGVHGVSTLPDVRGVQRDLYLYVDENNNRAMPVPKLFWKAVYNPNTRAGAVFLGVNNPYVENPAADYFICQDVSSKISWLTWNPKNQTLGYSYVCEVDDFRKVVHTLPWFRVDRLLE